MQIVKQSCSIYGNEYQNHQVYKYKNRDKNHWKDRIDLALNLVRKDDGTKLKAKEKKDVVADIGCSVGTLAIEFAKLGYRSYGIDFDSSALEIAKKLSKEENVEVEFINNDIANWATLSLPKIDIAICFDIFEHLHDDELGALLVSLQNQLSKNSKLIFHTFPAEYDYLFYFEGTMARIFVPWLRRLPLYLFKKLSEDKFERFVRAYASSFDFLYLIKKGRTHKELIKNNRHCNPLTKKRLEDILIRSGYKIIDIQTTQLYQFKEKIQKKFLHQPISHRNIFGVAVTE